ncbi:MAG: Zn-dependent hydrolase [Flavobacteriaceae bacterium]|nr:Zn-dependent hydrolase [Flavobacteriaceae bacterium]
MKKSLLIYLLSINILTAQNYEVDKDRIIDLFENLKQLGINENGGNDRIAYSDYDIQARKYLANKLENIGAKVYTDFAGNLIANYNPSNSKLKPISFGSHIDAVPNGGHYDGQVGVIGSVELLQTIHINKIKLNHPLELLVFSNEEGGVFGSRALAGKINNETLQVVTASGYSNSEGVNRIGGNSQRIFEVKRKLGDIHAFIEMHIEQGNNLYSDNIDIGIVNGIVGLKWWNVEIEGFSNHAGTTPMNQRQDAMIAAAKFILMVNETVNSFEGTQVGTVGRISALPGVPNVIPGNVNLSLELRDLSSEKISMIYNKIIENTKLIESETKTSFSFSPIDATGDPALMDNRLMKVIEQVSDSFGYSSVVMPSGAGHDAQDMAIIAPSAMIFVPSKEGISHSPKEFTDFDMIKKGTDVMLNSILKFDNLKID